MFKTEAKCYTWTHIVRENRHGEKVRGKGERSTLVTQGTYVIDHGPTGWFIVGTSRTVSAEVDKHIALLQAGRHPCAKLQFQYNWEPNLRLIEYPVANARDSKRVEAEIRSTNDTPYCLLN